MSEEASQTHETSVDPSDETLEITEHHETENERKCSDYDPDQTIHPFNVSNVTVLEKSLEINVEIPPKIVTSCDGSDSGVEINELRSFTKSNEDFEHNRSCDSSISYCSNYDEAFNILVRRNSSLFENVENGSDSSSVCSKTSKRASVRRKTPVDVTTNGKKVTTASSSSKDRTRTKPPITPRPQNSSNVAQNRVRPTNLTNNNANLKRKIFNTEGKKESKLVRTPSTSRTPLTTPTDGRWPSINSRPAPLMSKSVSKNSFDISTSKKTTQISDTKTIEKYATLPRRRKEKSDDSLEKPRNRSSARESSINRLSMPKKAAPPKETSKKRIKIYQENANQTALTMDDIEKILAGKTVVRPSSPEDKEFSEKNVQVDMRNFELEKLRDDFKELTKKYGELQKNSSSKDEKLKALEEKYRAEVLEKEGLQEELKRNTERVLSILGEQGGFPSTDSTNSDSLMVLETRFQNASQIVLNQEKEISDLNALCRSLQINLNQTLSNQAILMERHKELETESLELQEFMQAEKLTLADALRESETEINQLKTALSEKERELNEKQEESTHLVRLSEKRRQENLGMQARLGAMEAKCRELLVQQGSSVSGAAVALSALSNRLESLTNELITSYNITEEELDDVIVYHNEAYNSNETVEKTKKTSENSNSKQTSKGSSFVTAVINAIRNNAPFSRDVSRNNLQTTTTTSSSEMLDSETEPCLMMEHVLEDVVLPDGHSHNLISSTHNRLTHSESLKDLSRAIMNREKTEQSASLNTSFSGDSIDLSTSSLIDQVIDVDNSITRLLKVIRIIQMESEEYVNELEDHKECMDEQIDKQKETNVFVVKQLKDWEFLGAKLKNEVKELEEKIVEKDVELEALKGEVSKQREQLEKQNQDVCELSTALSRIELDAKLRREEANDAIERWEKDGEIPSREILGRMINFSEKRGRFMKNDELDKDKEVLIEKVKEAVMEVKKQYEAIDRALDVLHNVQSVVQQCPQLAKLQSDLEMLSFESASKMPILPSTSTNNSDLNSNAALLNVIKNLEINTTA